MNIYIYIYMNVALKEKKRMSLLSASKTVWRQDKDKGFLF